MRVEFEGVGFSGQGLVVLATHSASTARMAMAKDSWASQSVRCALGNRHALPPSAPLAPIFASCYGARCTVGGGAGPMRWFSTPDTKGFKDYKMPPVNPPEKENPDPVTLRAQWDNAVRLYGRMYSHAWGTAILAGVTLFGIGWWVKGENPLKALDPTGQINKGKPAD